MGLCGNCYSLIINENVSLGFDNDTVRTGAQHLIIDCVFRRRGALDGDSLESGHVESGIIEVFSKGHIDIQNFAEGVLEVRIDGDINAVN